MIWSLLRCFPFQSCVSFSLLSLSLMEPVWVLLCSDTELLMSFLSNSTLLPLVPIWTETLFVLCYFPFLPPPFPLFLIIHPCVAIAM